MTELQSLLLGAIQGLTEFLPISSSGHLLLAKQYIGIPHIPIAVDVLLHVATLVVVMWYFRATLFTIVKHLLLTVKHKRWTRNNRVIIATSKLAFASVCTAIIGGMIYAVLPLDNLTTTGIGYVLTAAMLGTAFVVIKKRSAAVIVSEKPPLFAKSCSTPSSVLPSSTLSIQSHSTTQSEGQADDTAQSVSHELPTTQLKRQAYVQQWNSESIVDTLSIIPWKTVVLIGIVQGCAVIPGISRAGNTIATARIMGLSGSCAMVVSFLLAIPAICGATIIQLLDPQFDQSVLAQSMWGMVAAIVFGYGALILLDKFLTAKSKQWLFIPYLIFLAIVSFNGIR